MSTESFEKMKEMDGSLAAVNSIDSMYEKLTQRFGGYEDKVRQCLAVMMLALSPYDGMDQFDKFARYKRPRGLLIYGPIGCGKSMLMNELVQTFGVHFMHIRTSILSHK